MLEPGFRRGRSPKRLTLRILQVPFDRLEIGIDRLVIGALDLDPMTSRIKDIEEEGIRDAMAAGTAFDV